MANEMVGSAQQFSPDVARAQASADVRSTRAEMREAQELGPALGKFIDAQSRASDEIAKILLPIKKYIVEVLAQAMEFVVAALRTIREILIGIRETLKALPEIIIRAVTLQLPTAWRLIAGLPDRIANAVRAGMAQPQEIQDVLMNDLARFEVPWLDWTAEGRRWMAGGRVGPRPPDELEPNMALR